MSRLSSVMHLKTSQTVRSYIRNTLMDSNWAHPICMSRDGKKLQSHWLTQPLNCIDKPNLKQVAKRQLRETSVSLLELGITFSHNFLSVCLSVCLSIHVLNKSTLLQLGYWQSSPKGGTLQSKTQLTVTMNVF